LGWFRLYAATDCFYSPQEVIMGGLLRILLLLIGLVGALAMLPINGPPLRVPHEFEGQPLRYLIGADDVVWQDQNGVVEVGYDAESCPPEVLCIAYCNLFNEKWHAQTAEERAAYEPYLRTSDTAKEYQEGQIDPKGPGWDKNLHEQFKRRRQAGFRYIELDNPDAYLIDDVLRALDLAASYGFKVVAKNPLLMGEKAALAYIKHPAIVGVIVEHEAGDTAQYLRLRVSAGQLSLPVWFVFHGRKQEAAANAMAKTARSYLNMGVTISLNGEYTEVIDLAVPLPSAFDKAA